MDAQYVGIDVSKARLDVSVRPSGEAFVVARDDKGLAELVERLHGLAPRLIAVEATGGYETVEEYSEAVDDIGDEEMDEPMEEEEEPLAASPRMPGPPADIFQAAPSS